MTLLVFRDSSRTFTIAKSASLVIHLSDSLLKLPAMRQTRHADLIAPLSRLRRMRSRTSARSGVDVDRLFVHRRLKSKHRHGRLLQVLIKCRDRIAPTICRRQQVRVREIKTAIRHQGESVESVVTPLKSESIG